MTRIVSSDAPYPPFNSAPLPGVTSATSSKLLIAHLVDVSCLAALGAVAWLVRPSLGFVGVIVGEGLVVLALTRATLGRSPGAYATGTAWVQAGTHQAPGLGRALARVGLLALLLLTVVGPAVSILLARNGQDWIDRLVGTSGVDLRRQPSPTAASYAPRPSPARAVGGAQPAGGSGPDVGRRPAPPPQHAAPAGTRRPERGNLPPGSQFGGRPQPARALGSVPAGAGVPSSPTGRGGRGGAASVSSPTGHAPGPRPVLPVPPLSSPPPVAPPRPGAPGLQPPPLAPPTPVRPVSAPGTGSPAAGAGRTAPPRAVPMPARPAVPSVQPGPAAPRPTRQPAAPTGSPSAATGRTTGGPAPAGGMPPNVAPRRAPNVATGRHRATGPTAPQLHTVRPTVPTQRAPQPSAVTPSGATPRVPGGFLPGAAPSTAPQSEGLTGPIPKVESRPVPTTSQLSRSVLLRPDPTPPGDSKPTPPTGGSGESGSPAQPRLHVVDTKTGAAPQAPATSGPQVHVVGPPRTRRAARRADPPQ